MLRSDFSAVFQLRLILTKERSLHFVIHSSREQ